jgi:hypothetical protein
MPLHERLFPSARFRRGHQTLPAEKTLVQVQWAEDAERFDLRSAAVVATAVADVEVPANACPMAPGQVWRMEACGEAGTARFEVVAVRLVEVRPGPNKFRRRYTWQFLVVRRPTQDPYRLFPRLVRPAAVEELAELRTAATS